MTPFLDSAARPVRRSGKEAVSTTGAAECTHNTEVRVEGGSHDGGTQLRGAYLRSGCDAAPRQLPMDSKAESLSPSNFLFRGPFTRNEWHSDSEEKRGRERERWRG
eukprot:CAMPEP_0174304788 /NCGR_PEP_ID=MMETSP0809-20121228/60996_1 /TAXON_ID=73025 ORGANISM="Eutreptiella gymnastica-like, Strain CCMP1594" /NCGR_SAMPLE_ID=MMETSP0809 /ASSEMBLY_ACC=CAM_ASM_000658 /LENGTH=105 /DNA_ID=CAMNT_0015411087 /DNA_START=1731 /DNA_END=2045 /DNA_ORIENTATION=+